MKERKRQMSTATPAITKRCQ